MTPEQLADSLATGRYGVYRTSLVDSLLEKVVDPSLGSSAIDFFWGMGCGICLGLFVAGIFYMLVRYYRETIRPKRLKAMAEELKRLETTGAEATTGSN